MFIHCIKVKSIKLFSQFDKFYFKYLTYAFAIIEKIPNTRSLSYSVMTPTVDKKIIVTGPMTRSYSKGESMDYKDLDHHDIHQQHKLQDQTVSDYDEDTENHGSYSKNKSR